MSDILEKVEKTKTKFVGLKQLLRGVDFQTVEMVVLAKDADENIKTQVCEICNRQNLKLETVTSMKELGEYAGISVKASVVTLFKL